MLNNAASVPEIANVIVSELSASVAVAVYISWLAPLFSKIAFAIFADVIWGTLVLETGQAGSSVKSIVIVTGKDVKGVSFS